MQTDQDKQITQQEDKIQKLYSSQQVKQPIPNAQELWDIKDSNIGKDKLQEEMDKDIPLKQQEQEEYNYEDYGDYDGNQELMMDYELQTYNKRISSENNTQIKMEDLIKFIENDNQNVIQLTGFDREWALIYYQTCGWRMHNVSHYIDEKLSSHEIVHFKPSKAQISSLQGTCDICCLQNQLIFKNVCGDEFCEVCWKGHLRQRMQTFYTDPFPKCMNDECQNKTSPFILEEISKNDSSFQKLYLRTLCRSYAMGNTSVKMCKGRQGFSCDQCFKISKLLEMVQCQKCGNLVCAMCGQEYHSPSECLDGKSWRKVVEQSTNFVSTLNYRICPSCHEAVQRSTGCNSVICKCGKTFCYICGQKWLPNHTQHGVCYRQKQIKVLEDQRKKKNQNQKEYIDKLQKFKAEIEKYIEKIKKVDKVNVEQIKTALIKEFKILSNQLDYLPSLKKKLKLSLIVGKNYVLSLYFADNEVMKAGLANLTPLIQKSYDLLVQTLPVMIEAFSEKETVDKRATQMRNLKICPQEKLAIQKLQVLGILKKMEKYIIS